MENLLEITMQYGDGGSDLFDGDDTHDECDLVKSPKVDFAYFARRT